MQDSVLVTSWFWWLEVDGISCLLVTPFECCYPTLIQKKIDVGDQNDVNRPNIFKFSPKNFISSIRHQHRPLFSSKLCWQLFWLSRWELFWCNRSVIMNLVDPWVFWNCYHCVSHFDLQRKFTRNEFMKIQDLKWCKLFVCYP